MQGNCQIMILLYDLTEYDQLCFEVIFSLWEENHVITHRATYQYIQKQRKASQQFDLLFKMIAKRLFLPTLIFKVVNRYKFYKSIDNWEIYTGFLKINPKLLLFIESTTEKIKVAINLMLFLTSFSTRLKKSNKTILFNLHNFKILLNFTDRYESLDVKLPASRISEFGFHGIIN